MELKEELEREIREEACLRRACIKDLAERDIKLADAPSYQETQVMIPLRFSKDNFERSLHDRKEGVFQRAVDLP